MDKELERAQVLDEILKIIDKSNPPGRASVTVYLAELEQELQTENVLLVRYLREEARVFEIQASYEQMGKTQGTVVLTPEGKYKLKEEGPWFESDLLFRQEQKKMYAHHSRQRDEDMAREKVKKKMQEDKEKEERNQLDRERLEREQRAEEREIAREKREIVLVKEVADSRASEAKVRTWNLWLAIATVIFGGVAAYGALKDKLFDTKEHELQVQITKLNNSIESMQQTNYKLLKQLNAIPDSIKEQYIK